MDMKKLVFCIAVLISSQLFAQSNLTLFTEEGEKFTLFLNGVIQNKAFQTNVHVENINANTQKLRIVFEDKSIPSISENIYYETYNDYTYVIRKKKNVASKVKKLDGKAAINAYVLRLQDVKPLDRISISEKVDVVQSIDVETNEVKPIENITTNVTTTTTKTSNKPNNENVNINVGINGVGINMNVSGIENQNNIETVVLRPCNIIGPQIKNSITQFFKTPYSPLPVDYNPMFQFVHEFDMANIIVESVQRLKTGIYNVAGDDVISLHEASNIIGVRKLRVPIIVVEQLAKILTPVWKFPLYLLDYLKYPATLDNSELKKNLGDDIFRFSTKEALELLKSH